MGTKCYTYDEKVSIRKNKMDKLKNNFLKKRIIGKGKDCKVKLI